MVHVGQIAVSLFETRLDFGRKSLRIRLAAAMKLLRGNVQTIGSLPFFHVIF
jgi:hypothetical protein